MTEALVLIALLIGSNIYWASICFKLTNRLMSRNYFEFKQSERKPIKSKPELVIDEPDEYAEAQAREINTLMNMV